MWTHEPLEYVTAAGEAWLASASEYPRSVRALWEARPGAPMVLPCGRVFDVVSMPELFGRRVLEVLWANGPGCGPVAAHRGRTLVFAQVGGAPRLRSLLVWEEWARDVPPLLCHGAGDAVTLPAVRRDPGAPAAQSRWIVAPDTREPWLPGASVLLWACVRAARSAEPAPPAPGDPRPERPASGSGLGAEPPAALRGLSPRRAGTDF